MTHKTCGFAYAWMAVALAAMFVTRPAEAQDPDIRSIKPAVILAVDTSGSMERRADCLCTTPQCNECLPVCGPDGVAQRNRWAVVTEALTGTYTSFACTQESRSGGAYVGQFDENYYVPHISITAAPQNSDGILDSYRDRVRFGLMTFDGVGTLTTASPLVEKLAFTSAGFLANSITDPGMYSYGTPREFWLPGCPSVYMIDNGARNASSPVGPLISIGPSTTDDTVINAQIQSALANVRPYGATPIAGMLDDVLYYFDHHPDVNSPTVVGTGDIYANCRPRYVLLLTDGYPSQDMRQDPYRCDAPGSTCPYKRPEELAQDLCQYDTNTGKCNGKIKGLFVVGFGLDDPAAVGRLNDIALMGGTSNALFANDRTELMSRLGQALDQAAAGATTRTIPVFSQSSSSTGPVQSQFSSGFVVGDATQPWSGVLERTRYECNSNLQPEAQALSDSAGDRFHKVLNARTAARVLYTVIPVNAANATKSLSGADQGVGSPGISSTDVLAAASTIGTGGPTCGTGSGISPTKTAPIIAETGLGLASFDLSNASLTPALVGASSSAQRDDVIRWVHAESTTARANARFGDVYHASPVTVPAPRRDNTDEAFNLFRLRPEVQNRPTVVYVGTNDGILHAFAAEHTSITAGPHAGRTLNAGEELWGFIPPVLLSKLTSAVSSHQIMVDGPIVVKDVFLKRTAGAAADGGIYRTVLIFGLRSGGNAYVALDVTDPLSPKFLWQFTSTFVNETYGTPGVGQVLMTMGDGSLQERAIAVLPGGNAVEITNTGGTCDVGITGCTPTGSGLPPVATNTTTRRSQYKCWGSQARQLYVLDIATGQVVRWFDDKVFNAPLVGGVSLYQGDVGSVASRGFVTDANGVIWRLDFGSKSVAQWDAKPIYDIFWDAAATASEISLFPPVISIDSQNRLIVLQSTGNIDRLDVGGNNRVVSLLENVTYNTSTGAVASVAFTQNWELKLNPGEQVTGPLELFNENVYFGTFKSTSSAIDACSFGSSNVCGVHYKNNISGTQSPKPGLESSPGSGTLDATCIGPYANQIIMGVSVTQRPSCFRGTETIDPYFGTRFMVSETGGGDFRLIAQLSGTAGSVAPTGAIISTVDRLLPTRRKLTRVQGWASSVDQ